MITIVFTHTRTARRQVRPYYDHYYNIFAVIDYKSYLSQVSVYSVSKIQNHETEKL
jgi:hypothetical protein